ncbi:hypothetical protein [Prosthecobacter sp.]|uniref:hypothetical protein n=1 Tax=Prosthecobacter sp. TaxID=1965333 RepID=UPI002ABC075D|nr:hypothetical protein [Prosthecobacter sp.]MDZ4403560.1 hypothetical protein [Prosthecobacter sp.]
MKRLPFILGLGLACSHAEAANEVIKPKGDPNDPGPKPDPNKQGTYDCMLKSMEEKQVTEPQTGKITRWGKPEKETWNGYVYWAIRLEYDLGTVFGKLEAVTRALIRNNHVHIWLYVGSDEWVP